ncbi:hypothetical protein FOVG_08237 [Fusarium oxysporum f. sp. pisi HDV247]|uniref:Uncharacterized protein n=1 Tax=Fusarium oxysporum f. sp. pisi HDV247 TaxID=1080344 RepID=W9PU27_FUSOX|nr:hypothetical protein FOVG_08237 [Fusarium oxysporum f. sp. pisi HDV247]
MHIRQPTVREPTHNQVRPMMKGFVEEVQEKMIILGVLVDSQMTFDLNVTEIIKKCRRRLGYMKRISGSTWGPDMYAVRQNYLTLIRPVITYACGAWFIKQRKCVSTPPLDSSVCILRQISSKNTSEISKATNEVLPGLTDSASPEELFDMSFDHWDIPSPARLRETAERLQRHRFLDSLSSWLPIQRDDPRWFDATYKGPKYTYRRKYWFSATAVAIRFLNRLSLTQRGYLHKLVLNEDRISVGFPESHAIGLIPFFKQNPKLHVEQWVDVWQNLVIGSEQPSAYGPNGMIFERSEPQPGEFHCLDSISGPDQDVAFSNWVVHGFEVVKLGMPSGPWSVIFDGSPDLNLATELFTTLLQRTIVWQTFYTDCVSLGLFTDPSHYHIRRESF